MLSLLEAQGLGVVERDRLGRMGKRSRELGVVAFVAEGTESTSDRLADELNLERDARADC